jgi:hypothetical protein
VARIDDYKEAFRLAAEKLKEANLHRIASLAGAEIDILEDGRTSQLKVAFLGEPFIVRVGDAVVIEKEGQTVEVGLPEKILISHYLLNASGDPPTGELITFRQIPDGHFYFDAFQRRARNPFLSTFGQDRELFRECAQALGGKPVDVGDIGIVFQALPRIPIQIALWAGDEEFPPEASILFDANIQRYLPIEDIAVLSGMLVYRLMGIARSRKQGA